MRVGQPVVQRRETDLRAVADQQEHERELEHGRLELRLDRVEMRPEQRSDALGAEDLLGGEIQQHRPEQRLRDADTAQDEVLPARFEARRSAVQRDQQHRGQRRRLHRDPQEPHVVGRERKQHRRHEELIHAVVEPQAPGGDAAMIDLDPHVRPREQRGRQSDEGGQRDQKHVERVDEELLAPEQQAALRDDPRGQRAGRDERGSAEHDVELRRPAPAADDGEHQRAGQRDREQQHELHFSVSRSDSRWCRSRLSNCSRIWKKNTPSTSIATSTSSATPSSTTIGMP